MWWFRCPSLKSRSLYLANLHPLASTQGILCVCQSGAKVVDLPLSSKQMVTQIQRKTRAVRHHVSKDLWVHSRDLESILLPLRVECIDEVFKSQCREQFQLIRTSQVALATTSA
jgi:hypothetical protein